MAPTPNPPLLERSVLSVTFDIRVRAPLRHTFEAALCTALCTRHGIRTIVVSLDDAPDRLLVTIEAVGRAHPLVLHFPSAETMDATDVVRIVRNVLQAMGPAAP